MAPTNRLVLFAQTFGMLKNTIINKENIKFNKPGLPKLVPFAFIPAITICFSTTKLQGKKHNTMTNRAIIVPVN